MQAANFKRKIVPRKLHDTDQQKPKIKTQIFTINH